MKIVTLADARKRGLKRYFTGVTCPDGHIAARYVSSEGCVVCAANRVTRKRSTHPEIFKAYRRKGYTKDIEACRARAKAGYQKRADHCRAYGKKRYWEKRDELMVYKAAYRAAYPEKTATYSKAYYAANKEMLSRKHARWREKNPEMKRLYEAHRRAKKNAAPGAYTKEDILGILKAQRHRCPYCRADLRKVKWHIDHIMPFDLGGTNFKENIQCTCYSCNSSKRDKHPDDFAREMGLDPNSMRRGHWL